ncbi:unnamed protein product [Closterium sp. NIES-65]|nr:unnamed protein product [Closterium sp. NIES-65]
MALAVAAPAQSASPAILSLDRATSSRASHVSHISQVATARAFPRDARLAAHLDAFALASAARPSARQDSHKHRAWRLRTRGRTGDDATLSSSSDDVPKEAKERAAAQEKARSLVGDLKGTSIFLVGMMGSGKTTVGTLLADLLGYCFFDSDRVVEAAAGGASVAQIFAENGEEEFREIEVRRRWGGEGGREKGEVRGGWGGKETRGGNGVRGRECWGEGRGRGGKGVGEREGSVSWCVMWLPDEPVFACQLHELNKTRVLAELSSMGRLVVATGGGAVTRPVNCAFIRAHGADWHPVQAGSCLSLAPSLNEPSLSYLSHGEHLAERVGSWPPLVSLFFGLTLAPTRTYLSPKVTVRLHLPMEHLAGRAVGLWLISSLLPPHAPRIAGATSPMLSPCIRTSYLSHGATVHLDVPVEHLAERAGSCLMVAAWCALSHPCSLPNEPTRSYLSHGVTVHLDVPVEHLAERVVAVGTAVRPLLSQPTQGEGEGGKQQAADESDEYGKVSEEYSKVSDEYSTVSDEYSNTLTRLAGLLGERKSLYSNADTTISLQEVAMRSASQVHEVTPTRIALEILERLEQMVAERQARDAALRAKAA